MSAVLYLAVVAFAGDAIASRWFAYVSLAHRVATALLVGVLVGTWATYVSALALSNTAADPMAAGAVVSGLGLALAGVLIRRLPARVRPPSLRSVRRRRREWAVVALFAALVTWMMVATYDFADGAVRIANGVWSDFGPTTAIAQSFAIGHNFPTEYPHYAGEPIRYHFLFYFQVGNLTHLGLNPAVANNALSIVTMVAMLGLVAALGQRLFRSRVVGWFGAALFFFHGALSFIPFLMRLGTVDLIVGTVPKLDRFMASGFPYRGEEWGIWTQIVFLNQRHLASGIGILLVIALFLLERVRDRETVRGPWGVAERPDAARGRAAIRARARVVADSARALAASVRNGGVRPVRRVRAALTDRALGGYVVCGLLAGLLPLWNGAMFIAAAALLAVWLVLFPNRLQMMVLAAAAAVPSVPQLLWVRPGTMAGEQTYPAVFLGYTIGDPTLGALATYFAFIFGPKLLLAAVGLLRSTWRQARVFIAFSTLVVVAFAFQFSVEVLANHKFINAWLIVLNLFAAYGLHRLWRARGLLAVPARAVAAGLAAIIVAGGVIDLMPIKNQQLIGIKMEGDRLVDWVTTETGRTDVFLGDIYVVHPILLAGRRVYFGWPYFAWSAGYAVAAREQEYRELFALRSPRELVRRLQAHGIDYVAFDDGLRDRGFAPKLNEELFRRHFETVFTDTENRYAHLSIYRVPPDPLAGRALPDADLVDMYVGGRGSQPGQFAEPRGLASDRSGNVFVADTGNHRVEQFSSAGNLLATIGGQGMEPGRFDRPTGVAVTKEGRLWVADSGNRRIQEFDAEGTFLSELGGGDTPLVHPVDVASDGDRVFVLDAGAGRILRRAGDGTTMSWGGLGNGDGQLSEPTGIAVAGDKVVVADTGNRRVVVFDADGKLVESWPVAEWGTTGAGVPDVATDGTTVWASDPAGNAILVYRSGGTLAGRLAPLDPAPLDGPSGIALKSGGAMFVGNAGANRISLLTQIQP